MHLLLLFFVPLAFSLPFMSLDDPKNPYFVCRTCELYILELDRELHALDVVTEATLNKSIRELCMRLQLPAIEQVCAAVRRAPPSAFLEVTTQDVFDLEPVSICQAIKSCPMT